ncbi:MAG: acetylglutamate kinase [Gemmatimonadaceae bacterium]|nr:acetylglutamate kinase [Gemmatimonadaceae bacterium]
MSGTVVVKLGGRAQGDPALPATLAERWRTTAGRLVIVHGGGDQVSTWQRLRGDEPVFVGGRRVTQAKDIELIRMVLSGSVNKTLVGALRVAGVNAVGLSGEDGGMLRAEPVDPERFGRVGAPATVDARLLELLLSNGWCPVVSPVGISTTTADPDALNVNGDDAAAAIAVALGARELFFLADVPAVLDADKAPIATIAREACQSMIDDGIAVGGMAAKLEAACVALDGGVSVVRIGDRAALVDGRGTAIVPSAVAAR